MAEVNTGGGHEKGKGKKTKQKKVDLRVDFTPMVDMNMLLITFFMFCTSLIKPQTMEINMPSKDAKVEDQSPVKDSEAVTIIMGGDNKIFYYFGMITPERYEEPGFLKETDYSESGLRAMLLSRNRNVVLEMRELNRKKQDEQMSEEDFTKRSIEIKGQKGAPTVMIKATDDANYKNLIDVLDEMQITNVGKYAIVDIQEGDQYLVDKYLGLLPVEESAN